MDKPTLGSVPQLSVPCRWQCIDSDDESHDLLLVSNWLPASGFRPRITLTHQVIIGSLADLQQELMLVAVDGLSAATIEDVDTLDIDGCDIAYLRVWHRAGDHELITELRTWLIDDVAWTIAASVDHRDYADFCDLFEEIAYGLDLNR